MDNSDIRLQSRTGPIYSADGSIPELRSGKNGELIIGQAHAKYFEAVSRGNVFIASHAVAGAAPGTAFTTTAFFSLWNPVSSGKNLVILKTSLGYVSGTLGVGNIAYGNSLNTAIPASGTAITIVPALVGGSASSVASAGTGHTVVAPTIIRPAFNIVTAVGAGAYVDYVDGEIIVAPGATLAIHASAMGAGSSPKMMVSVTFEEVPV